MPQPPEPKPQKPADVINIVYGLATVYSGCFTPILRSGFGSHAFAAYPASMLLMFVYSGAAKCPALLLYLPVWMLLVACRRLTSDPDQHSRYQGYPWTLGWLLGEFQARRLEPFICFFGGVFLCPVSESLGVFVMGGCVSLLIVLGTEMEVLRSRKRALHDARIEARRMSDMQRGGNGWD